MIRAVCAYAVPLRRACPAERLPCGAPEGQPPIFVGPAPVKIAPDSADVTNVESVCVGSVPGTTAASSSNDRSKGALTSSNSTTSSSGDWMAELSNQLLGRIKNHLEGQAILF